MQYILIFLHSPIKQVIRDTLQASAFHVGPPSNGSMVRNDAVRPLVRQSVTFGSINQERKFNFVGHIPPLYV